MRTVGGKLTPSVSAWRFVAVVATVILLPNAAAVGPPAPNNFAVTNTNGVTTLAWDAVGGATFQIFTGAEVNDLTIAGTTTSASFTVVSEGATQWYAVGTLDSRGQVGPVSYSNVLGTQTGQCVAVSKSGGVGISLSNCVSY